MSCYHISPHSKPSRYHISSCGDLFLIYHTQWSYFNISPHGDPIITYHHVVTLTHKRHIVLHHQADLPSTLLQEHRCLRQGEVGHVVVIDGQDPVPDLYGAFSVIPRVKDVHFALVYTLRIAIFVFRFIYYRGISHFFSLCIHDSRNMSNVLVKKIYCRILLLNFSENCLPYLSAGPPGRTWVTMSGRVLCCCSW